MRKVSIFLKMKILIFAVCISAVYSSNFIEDPGDSSFASKVFENIEGLVAVNPNQFPFTVKII